MPIITNFSVVEVSVLIFFAIPIIWLFGYELLHAFAKYTYKLAHKDNSAHKSAGKNVNVIFDIDVKNKTLQEIQFERMQMIKKLGGI